MTQESYSIVARSLSKAYGTGRLRTPVLTDISLEIKRGEVLFLAGPSGCGKTTLLTILGCLLTPCSGSLLIRDTEVSRLSNKELTAFRRQHMGFIFQSFNLFPTLSALDNIRLALAFHGFSNYEARKRAGHVLDLVGLGHRQKILPGRLSGGECQRVAIARALANSPKLIFADEPTAALDAENGQIVLKLLTDLVQENDGTLILVTHDHRIYPFADRICELEDGRVAHSGTGEEWATLRSSPTRKSGHRVAH